MKVEITKNLKDGISLWSCTVNLKSIKNNNIRNNIIKFLLSDENRTHILFSLDSYNIGVISYSFRDDDSLLDLEIELYEACEGSSHCENIKWLNEYFNKNYIDILIDVESEYVFKLNYKYDKSVQCNVQLTETQLYVRNLLEPIIGLDVNKAINPLSNINVINQIISNIKKDIINHFNS